MLEHFLHPYRVKYVTVLFPNLLKASAFNKVIILVKVYASGAIGLIAYSILYLLA